MCPHVSPLQPHTSTHKHTCIRVPWCLPFLPTPYAECMWGTVSSAHSTVRRAPHTPGTYLIPGMSSRLVKPVQLICRCCRAEGFY